MFLLRYLLIRIRLDLEASSSHKTFGASLWRCWRASQKRIIDYCMKLAWLLLVASTCSFTAALRNSLQPIGNRKMGVLPKTMKTEELHAAKCVTLTFASDPPLVTETNVISGRELLATNPGPFGTLLFVVRRPG